MQKIPRLSLSQCDEFWGSQFSPETCLLPFKTTIQFGQGLAGASVVGRSSTEGRNSWAVGRLRADAAPCLRAWGKVGCGQPQNSEVVRGPEQAL